MSGEIGVTRSVQGGHRPVLLHSLESVPQSRLAVAVIDDERGTVVLAQMSGDIPHESGAGGRDLGDGARRSFRRKGQDRGKHRSEAPAQALSIFVEADQPFCPTG